MSISDSTYTSPESLRQKYRNPKSVLGNVEESAQTASQPTNGDSGVSPFQPTNGDSTATFQESRRNESNIISNRDRQAQIEDLTY